MTNEELLNLIQHHKANAKDETAIANKYMALLEVKMESEGLPNLATDEATAYWQKQTKVEVKDWNVLMEYVHANKAYDMLQRRVSPLAVKARLDAGAKIAGVSYKEGAKTFIVKGKKEDEEESTS